MDVNVIIVWILMICMVLGGLDRAIGNKFGLGEQFEEGFNAMGPLALAMVGVMSISPILAKLLNPVIGPLYSAVGADPAMFAGTLLACDMGGWPLAQVMTGDPAAQRLSGLVLGAMMGPTIVFTIPVALGIIDKKDRGYLAKGILAGIVTVPLGVFVGGLAMGFPFGKLLLNLIPIIAAAALIAFGLWRAPEKMTTGFEWFGKGLVSVISIGLVVAVFQEMTGKNLLPWQEVDASGKVLNPDAWSLIPPSEGIAVVGMIAMMLLGAFPAVHLIVTLASKPLAKVGKLIGVNDAAAGGMIATLANNIPMFQIMKDMDPRGKVLNSAFAVSAAFAFGDHLGFVAGASRDMIAPVIAGKLVAGLSAVALALLMFGKTLPASDGQSVATVASEPEEA